MLNGDAHHSCTWEVSYALAVVDLSTHTHQVVLTHPLTQVVLTASADAGGTDAESIAAEDNTGKK